jgi:DNA-binding NarL/FixJ family response regulator
MRLLVIDEQTLIREGIKAIFYSHPNIIISRITDNFLQLKNTIIRAKPDVIVASDHILRHFEPKELKVFEQDFKFRFLLTTNIADSEQLNNLLTRHRYKFSCVSKNCSKVEITRAIQATHKGEVYYCSRVGNVLAESGSNEIVSKKLASLSNRELELIHLIAAGYTNQEIADQLFLSVHTIKSHRKNIIKKLGFTFKNAADLITLIGI